MILRLIDLADSIWTSEGFYELLDRYASGGYVVANAFNLFGNIINLALAILSIIGMWKMFTKAGENDWGAIIPFYNKYLLFKISDMKNWYWAYLILTVFYGIGFGAFIAFLVVSVFVTIGNDPSSESILRTTVDLGLGLLVLIILILILNIVRNVRLARNFHLSGWWVLGFLFLPGIFYMIVGCSGKIRFKDRLPSGLLPGQIPTGPQTAGPQGYGQQTYDPYRSQNVYAQSNVYGNQGNLYGAQNNPYGAPNPYAGNPYVQNANPYAQSNAFNSQAQNPYAQNAAASQNVYAQNTASQNVYTQNTSYASQSVYAQNSADASQNVSPVPQYGQNMASGAAQDPNAAVKGGRDEALWKTIYDDEANNIK